MTGPGYPLTRVLRDLPDRELDALLLGHHRLAEALLQAELSGEEKVDFLLRLRGAEELLKDTDVLGRIYNYLPSSKQQELVTRLGRRPGKQRLSSPQEKAVLSFFGASAEPKRSSTSRDVRLETVEPLYGLFDHQRDALARTQEYLGGHDRRVLLHMPTGAGKTRTAMHLVARHLRELEPTVVVWLAHSSELLAQAAEDFEVAWRSLGNRPVSLCRFWGTRDVDPLAGRDSFVVAGLAKLHLWSRESIDDFLLLADRTSLVVMDEAHQSVATTYKELLEGLATKRLSTCLLGLTATPGRTWAEPDADRELSRFFKGNKVLLSVEGYDNPVDYLMAEGYLAQPQFRTLNAEAGLALTEEDRDRLRDSLDIPQEILARLGESEQLNLKVIEGVDSLLAEHSRILVFALSVENARLIAATLSTKKYEVYCVTGNTPTRERQHAIKRFRSNVDRAVILVNFGVLTAGFDAPRASAAVIARPTKSLVLFSQMVGRVTRGPKAGGNETCEIVTVVDPSLPGFGSVGEAFVNWEDVWG